MSINSQIERLELAKADLFQAITAKGGVLTASQSISDYAAAVNGIEINTGSDIDFTGVTVTADKMLSGVVAVNASGVKVTGTIQTVTATKSGDVITVPKGYIAEQQTFNAGVILPTVSVTADKLLNGVTAINSNGATVTGTIPTVTASMSDNVVTVPSGYIASAQTLTVAEMSEPTVSKNIVTVSKGYNKAQKTVTIPLAAITETADSVTIGVGYVSEAKTYNLSSGSASSAEFGYLNADGTIQLYDFSVTPPVEKGSPITADIVSVLPRPYEGEIIEGEYLRFTAVEDSTVAVYGTAGICFDLACRKNSGVWNEAPSGSAFTLNAGEYVEFYGNYSGTAFLDIDLTEVESRASNTVNYKPFLAFETSGKLRCSGYLNSVSAFSNTLTTGTYSLLLGGCESVISSPIIPKMTAVYDSKTDEFPFEALIISSTMSEITVEFTDWNGAESVKWLKEVPETGVFRKPAALPTIFGKRDKDGICTYIPPNWTVENI